MTISKDTYLKVLGLWHLASEHNKKALEFHEALLTLLGAEEKGHISDSIFCGDVSFDEALKKEGIEVEDQ